MYCNNCGKENDNQAAFCVGCGTQLGVEQEQQYDQPVIKEITEVKDGISVVEKLKKLPLKLIAGGAGVVLVVILAFCIFSGQEGGYINDAIAFFTSDDVTYVSVNNEKRIALDGKATSTIISADKSSAAVSMEDDSLWFVDKSGKTKIADEVGEYCYMSQSGNKVAYFVDVSSQKGTLYVYDSSSKKSTRIADEVLIYGLLAFSPDGKSLSYISDFDEEKDELTGYIVKNEGSPEKLGASCMAIALSDGCKYVYYLKITTDPDSNETERALYVRVGEENIKLTASDFGYALFNKDCTEIMFSNDDKTYISVKGKEKVKVFSDYFSNVILPAGTATSYGNYSFGYCKIDTFAGSVMEVRGSLYYVDKNFETSKISGSTNCSKPTLSRDGKTLAFITESGNLVTIDPTKADAERTTVCKDVEGYNMSSDGKKIYYIDEDDTLFYTKNGGTPVKIADDVDGGITPSYDGKRLFFITEYSSSSGGTLYYSKDGGKKARIADDVKTVYSTATNIFYISDESVYRSNGDHKFQLFVEDVQ